jgi:parallel beta-helix repeat protein
VVDDDGVQCPGAGYATIQSAVSAASAGDTIKVCAGTYSGVVNIPVTLTFLGAQSGVDARTRVFNAATEAIVTDGFSVIGANNVTIDGFTIQGADGVGDLGTGINFPGATSGHSVVNNIIRDNIFGIYLNSSGASQTVVRHNLFESNNRPGAASGNAIYADQGSANVLIDANKFTGHTSAAMVFAGAQSNLTVSGNELINDNSMVFFNTNGVSITSNLSDGSLGSVIFIGGNDTNVTITCNTIRNAPTKTAIRLPNFGFGANSGVSANNNNIENMGFGIRIDPGQHIGTLNAENNWWGSPTGPTIASNPGGTGAAIVDPDGVVDYTPFRTAPVPDVDNDGVLDSCDSQIGPPTNKNQCKNGGWQNFNAPRTFKNQGDCIQYVNTGK